MKTKQPRKSILYARVAPEAHRQLKLLAESTDRTITATLERIIEASWNEHQKERESARADEGQ